MNDASSRPETAADSSKSSGVLFPVLGSLLLLMPLLTAVHAWLGGGPGKTWLTLFAIASLAVCIGGWRFFRGFLLLFGLVCSSALIVAGVFLYGVEEPSLALAAVPMQWFMPGLLLVTLALAAWELSRVPKLPLWARLIAPALAVFAAVPVVMGLLEGVPFVEVLVGLWTLPYWVQGAWFGAAVLLPLALLVVVLRSVIPAWRSRPFRRNVTLLSIFGLLTASLATGFVMTPRGLINLTAFVPVPASPNPLAQVAHSEDFANQKPAETAPAATEEVAPQSASSASEATMPVAKPAPTQADNGELWSQLESAVAAIPSDSFDPAAVVDAVGTDPEALFAWVRDETVLLPYCGALKGPEGVLLDRAGNSLDRALLLRELLARAGHKSRLAHAKLTSAQISTLLEVLDSETPITPDATGDTAQLARRAAAELGLDAAVVRRQLDAAARADNELHKALDVRTKRQSKAILKALGSGDAVDADHEAALADHWWVLLERRGAEPLNLDPSLKDAAAGDHFVEAQVALNLRSVKQLASIGAACDKRLHRVRVRAVAEVFDGNRLREHVLLDRELLPIELFGSSLALSVSSYGGPETLDPFSQVAPADKLVATLLQHNEWQPRLSIDTETAIGKVVTDTGEIRRQPGGGSGGGSGGTFGGLGGSLGGGGSKSEGVFTAFWWTFEVTTPGDGTRTERRQVFDLVGPAARASGTNGELDLHEKARTTRALALAGQSELIALSAAPSIDLLNSITTTRLMADRDAWQALYTQGKTLPIAELAERLNALSALRTPLERFALHRGRFAAASGWGPQTGLLVAAHHRRLRPDLSTDQAFDLITAPPNGVRRDGFEARVAAGIADTNLESLLAAGKTPASAEVSIANAFERAPRSWRIVRQSDALEGSPLSADLAALVSKDLADGFIALVPTDDRDAVGWWRIDPNTGATLGFGSRGWGQATASYAERAQVLLQVRSIINSYGSLGQCLMMAVTQPLKGIETGVTEDLAGCIFTTVCGAVNEALSNMVGGPPDWTVIILMTTISELWGGTPEVGFGGLCGGLWSKMK